MKPTTIITMVATTAALLIAGCEGQEEPAASVAETPSWVLASAPSGAQNITDAKAAAVEGDEIAIRGIIGGTMEPISAASPVFRIVDTGLFNRCTSDDDHCSTPWDYCCAAPEDVVASSATVQLINADGSPFTGDPTANLDPLDEVILVGTVGPRPNSDVLTIKATGVYRSP